MKPSVRKLASAGILAAILVSCSQNEAAPPPETTAPSPASPQAEAPAPSPDPAPEATEVAAGAPSPTPVSDAPPVPAVSPSPTSADTPAAAVSPDEIMIVMDGSGSMWGQIDGVAKMEIARTALRDLVDGLPASTPAGLMAYGHRRQKDCSDIEVLKTPAANASGDIISAADAITPRGKTPLSDAVRQAAELMGYQDDPATVILITDGIETCDVDPCALGAELESKGVNFTAHVVGFGLSESEGQQVACLAHETGGVYLEASNASELSEAMEDVAAAVEEPPAPVTPPTATLTVPETVEIGRTFDVAWTGPDNPTEHDYIDLVAPDTWHTYSALSHEYSRNGPPVALRAPAQPGDYKVRYIWHGGGERHIISEAPIEVVDAEAAIFAPERVGIGQPFQLTWRGPDNKNDYIDLVPPDQTHTNSQIAYAYTKNGDTLEITAPSQPAELVLRYVTNGSGGERVLTSVPITIEETRAEVAFNPVVELGAVLEVSWTGPDTKNDYIDIVARGNTDTRTQLSYAYTKNGDPAELRVPGDPGEYDVRYILSASDGERILARAPLTLKDADVALDAPATATVGDEIIVTWTGPNARNDYVDIVPRGNTNTRAQLAYAYTKNGNPASLESPKNPGEYDIRYIHSASDGERILATVPLSLADVEVTLQHKPDIPLGETLEVAWTGPTGPRDYIDIMKRGDTNTRTQLSYAYTKNGDVLELSVPAEPGDYDVRFILNAADGERIMKRSPLSVTDVVASLTAPDTAAPGAVVEVSWTGPETNRNYIDIAAEGKLLPRDSIHYAYTRNGDPAELKMPDEPGTYDIRFIHEGSDKKVVKARHTIRVE